ncbi:tetratricopeptide repeat protein [uncultured Brevundimonas sp.]|uniref:tetratricopeptide repeat protein n=1 Tax=uncultured Brevundimonas sp. TaxID=213418 RepID=UPI002627FB66|nr:tetratricopeptide repeat protein [uncultured Brevundimonas sp.]
MKPIRPLLLTTSIAALIMGTPALAQETPVPEAETTQAPAQSDTSEPVIEVAPAEPDAAEDAVEGEDGEAAETELPPEPIIAIPAEWAPVPVDREGRSAYGHYLAARAALAQGETGEGARVLQQAYNLTPEQPRLREQAFTAALLAGDLAFAGRITPEAEGTSPVIVEAGKLVNGIETYLKDGARRANRLFAENPVELPHDRAAVYAQVWIAAEAGDWNRALAAPPADFDPISVLVARSNRARLLEIRRRYEEAEAEWKELVAHAQAGALFRLAYGEFLERRGRKEEALALYEAAISAQQAEARIFVARDRVKSGGRPPAVPRYREGLAMALRTAADQMIAQSAEEFAAVYLRLAQQVVPSVQNQFMIGQSLINAGFASAGRDALAEIPQSDVNLYANARAQRGVSFEKQDMDEEALAEFRLAVEAVPNEPSLTYALAGQLVKMDRDAEALELLNGPVLNVANQGYEVHFLRGAVLEALGRSDEAEAELVRAYQLAPNDPTVLNYLGYMWVDTGHKVVEGTELITRAVNADPNDGHFQDSLGWARFKQGQYEQAVENIEQAVAKEPANAEINDHLGDVYYALGRHREAGFQWQRVLTLDVDAKRRAEVEAKLRDRLNQRPYGEEGHSAASEDVAAVTND